MKHEYQKNPTEQLQLRLEGKQQMLRRVEDQLRSLTLVDLNVGQLSDLKDNWVPVYLFCFWSVPNATTRYGVSYKRGELG